MLGMVAYSRRPQSGQITCYLNRTYHVLLTATHIFLDPPKPAPYPESGGHSYSCRHQPTHPTAARSGASPAGCRPVFDNQPLVPIPPTPLVIGRRFALLRHFSRHKSLI